MSAVWRPDGSAKPGTATPAVRHAVLNRYALQNGRIVTTDAFRLGSLGERLSQGAFALALDPDPKQARAIVLGIEDGQTITRSDIPLDPR